MDYSVLIGQKIVHGGLKGLGEGTIVDLDGNRLIVDFGEEEKGFVVTNFRHENIRKLFSFPDADTEKIIDAAAEELLEAEALIRQQEAAQRDAEERERVAEARRSDIRAGLGRAYNVKFLKLDEVYTYQKVEEKHSIKIYPFGRGCNAARDSVVLISNIGSAGGTFVYHDRWDDNGDYIYSGEGQRGDQSMTGGNLLIKNTKENGQPIHLFVKFSPQEYYYQGVFELVDHLKENDFDADGNMRKEFKFRLRRV